MARAVLIAGCVNPRTPPGGNRARRQTTPPSEGLGSIPRPASVKRRQSAVIRDLIRLDVSAPRFETEGLALIRGLLEEDDDFDDIAD